MLSKSPGTPVRQDSCPDGKTPELFCSLCKAVGVQGEAPVSRLGRAHSLANTPATTLALDPQPRKLPQPWPEAARVPGGPGDRVPGQYPLCPQAPWVHLYQSYSVCCVSPEWGRGFPSDPTSFQSVLWLLKVTGAQGDQEDAGGTGGGAPGLGVASDLACCWAALDKPLHTPGASVLPTFSLWGCHTHLPGAQAEPAAELPACSVWHPGCVGG